MLIASSDVSMLMDCETLAEMGAKGSMAPSRGAKLSNDSAADVGCGERELRSVEAWSFERACGSVRGSGGDLGLRLR